jgi:hypothetical protein
MRASSARATAVLAISAMAACDRVPAEPAEEAPSRQPVRAPCRSCALHLLSLGPAAQAAASATRLSEV